jgi:hypothetical protein
MAQAGDLRARVRSGAGHTELGERRHGVGATGSWVSSSPPRRRSQGDHRAGVARGAVALQHGHLAGRDVRPTGCRRGAVILVTSIGLAAASGLRTRTYRKRAPGCPRRVRNDPGRTGDRRCDDRDRGDGGAPGLSQEAAYPAATGLQAGHFVTMHGLLVLPVLASLTAHTTWTEERRTRVVELGCASYVLAAGAVVMTSLLGIDPLTAPALVPTGLGLFGLLAAGASTHRDRTACKCEMMTRLSRPGQRSAWRSLPILSSPEAQAP